MRDPIDEQLAQVPLFSHLSDRHLRSVAGLTTLVEVSAGRALLREGELGREFMAIVEGEADVRRGDETIAHYGPGDFFGEIALLSDRTRTASVVATTDMLLEVIEGRDFRGMILDNPELAEPIFAAMAERLAALGATDD